MGGIAAGMVEIVQHHYQRVMIHPVQLAQQLQQIDLVSDVQPGGRFIQQKQRRLLG
ncbi:hypothetical protein D3C76_1862910 [compost metagenome]